MNIRIYNKKGNYQDVQHFDVAAWIENGWLTSEPKHEGASHLVDENEPDPVSPLVKPFQSPLPEKTKNKN